MFDELQVFSDHVIAVIDRHALGQHKGAHRFAQSFAGESDAARDSRQPGDHRRFEQSLEIEREVESRFAQSGHRLADRGLRLDIHQAPPPAAQIEFDQFVQARAPLQQLRRAALLDGPGDARLRHRAPQRIERGQRVNDVADGAELDDQYPHKFATGGQGDGATGRRHRHRYRPVAPSPYPPVTSSIPRIHFTASSKSSATWSGCRGQRWRSVSYSPRPKPVMTITLRAPAAWPASMSR